MATGEYESAYNAAMAEIFQLEAQKRQLEVRLYVLKQAAVQLATLAGKPASQPVFPMPKLTQAIENIFNKSEVGQRITPREIRDQLVAGGFSTKPYKNFLASIHAVLRRMEERNEIERDEESGSLRVKALPGSEGVPLLNAVQLDEQKRK
jgi:hypothetical protein